MTHWPAKNLGELISFLSTQHPGGLSANAISRRCQVSPQAISGRFLKDDANLSVAERMARVYGYQLELSFQKQVAGNPVPPSVSFPNAGNLQGLVKVLTREQITIHQIARRVHVDYSVISRAFRKGDIRISVLKSIVAAYGITMEWNWVPARTNNRDES